MYDNNNNYDEVMDAVFGYKYNDAYDEYEFSARGRVVAKATGVGGYSDEFCSFGDE